MRPEQLTKAIDILEQVHDTLEWQVGSGIPAVDFVFPKIKYVLNFLQDAQEDEEEYSESTSREELEKYVQSTFDFRMTSDDEDDR